MVTMVTQEVLQTHFLHHKTLSISISGKELCWRFLLEKQVQLYIKVSERNEQRVLGLPSGCQLSLAV